MGGALKIFVMNHWYLPHHRAGAEVMLHSMLRPLAERGHDVHVLESRLPADENYKHDGFVLDGVHVHARKSPEGFPDDPAEFLADADVVITQLENTPRAIILSRFANKPCFVVNHNDKPNARAFAHEAGNVRHVYNSQWVREALGDLPGSLVVRPPVNPAEFSGSTGQKVTLVNLNPEKGAWVFYELAERNPSIEFLGVCGAYDMQVGPHLDLPNVEIWPHQRDMRKVYEQTRVLLMPSEYESWGMCAVEAAASGIPTMACPTPGLVESLDYAGNFIEQWDIAKWSYRLKDLLKVDDWRNASEAAKRRSDDLKKITDDDIENWVAAVEGAV